ncbi:hypothetical protein SAMN05444338_104212 [Flavobacterium degerlachei]|jgi:hypothetical protein|uniref:Uncharacterized protein n=1 Tax=Flavobacterium degerlachei TaxID=229203 RepID=A0A1H2W271_9FLAO|nr:hypothetical protein SAMN05444338_104212 [Flavobacterium degerlachei]
MLQTYFKINKTNPKRTLNTAETDQKTKAIQD